jgi:hypothetical protein
MTDRELLELAAKAAGIKYDPKLSEPHENGTWWGLWLKYDREPHEFDRRNWNPLTDDGDAFRMMTDLRMAVQVRREFTIASARGPHGIRPEVMWNNADGKAEAARRAIVMCAAEIGKAMT